MARTVALDQQYFNDIRENNLFYIDKTAFIRQWWNNHDRVTLITRPRRFGKTLMMSTVEQFLSTRYAGRADLFKGLAVWEDEKFHAIQGSYPVISLSFASVKPVTMADAREAICDSIIEQYDLFRHELEHCSLTETELEQVHSVRHGMTDVTAQKAINHLCGYLSRSCGKKTVILLDEYDTPLQEAWLKGFWQEMVDFLRGFFNATFKTNPHLERALLTGVTRVSKESLFSDFNNLRVVGITTRMYETAFGFTEEEVFASMAEYGLSDRVGVKAMYDGFTFGAMTGIYNPWSIICYLQEQIFKTWWSNTSSNSLVGRLIREGGVALKQDFMTLLAGGTIVTPIDEQIVFENLDGSDESVWSLLLAAGYLKIVSGRSTEGKDGGEYELALTNGEVRRAMRGLVGGWFRSGKTGTTYNDFLKALLEGDLDGLNEDMNKLALSMFSFFDTTGGAGGHEPERFYHGFVLGLLVDLRDRYILTSNRESGRGRYDVMLEPRDPARDDAIIIEFKVHRPSMEASLEDTVAAALAQIEAKGYAQQLRERGIPEERIRKYGFAFRGKEVLIG